MKEKWMLSMVAAIVGLGMLMRPCAAHGPVSLKASDPDPPDGAEGVKTPLLQWRAGATAVAHDVYFGTNPIPGPGEFVGQQTWTVYWHPAGLVPDTLYYWRIDEIEPDGTVHIGDVWSFRALSLVATNPNPPDGAVSVDPDVNLTWTAGFEAAIHKLYFGTDQNAVANGAAGAFKGSQASTTYDPGTLQSDTTYYWRIDEMGGHGITYEGAVWHFTTAGLPQEGTFHVDGESGSDENDGLSRETAFQTIQKGMGSAEDGDRILVYPAVYHERIDFLGKAVTVRSAEDAAVLENPGDFAVCFYMGEGPGSTLENFIIRNSFMGIFIVQSSPTIRNVTVANNRYGCEAYADAEPDISNCIFWYNTGTDLFGCRARYSCIEHGSDGEGNLSIDPLFAHPDASDYHLLSERGRYWPEHDIWVLDEVTSPCVDAGDPDADFSAEPVPNGGRINMGAYGGTAQASMSKLWLPGADVNRDGKVDTTDLAMLVENWVKCGHVPGTNQPPEVNITMPLDGAVLNSYERIEIESVARDIDGFVVKVEFFANGEKIGEDTDFSDGWAFDGSDLPPGEYRLVALATDNAGATADSTAVVIEISDSRPPSRR
ncbi:MAG: hypothetical protein JSU70_15025 [Phycisphaerales bacterium]|nr:MAG: hypothetical protein JSU70_15025 [Phycisphaerales bacterium]